MSDERPAGLPPMSAGDTANITLAAAAFVNEVEAVGRRLIDLLVFGRKIRSSPPARAAAGLLSTMSEQFVSSIAVLRSPAPSDAMILIRSMIEAQADYYCLLKDAKNHWLRMELTAAKSFVDVMEGFMADPETKDAVDASKREQVKNAQKIVNALQVKGVKGYKNKFEKFEVAGLAPNYLAFQFLCSPAHTDMNAVIARHFRGKDRLIVFDSMAPVMLRSLCAVMIRALSQCVGRLPEYSDLSADRANEVVAKVNAAWESAVKKLDNAEKLEPMK